MTPAKRSSVLVLATQPLAGAVARALGPDGLQVTVHEYADGALKTMFDTQPSLVVLEHGLMDANGTALLAAIRLITDVPAIVVGRDPSESTAVEVLRGGADRYFSLPLRPAELAANVEAQLRRGEAADVRPPTYSDAMLEVDFQSYSVRVRGVDIALTPVEFRLLGAFASSAGRTLTPEDILVAVWGDATLPRDRVKLYIGYLRNKLRRAGVELAIETVRGFGYRYRPTPDLDQGLEKLLAELEGLRGPSGQPFFPNSAARTELHHALSGA